MRAPYPSSALFGGSTGYKACDERGESRTVPVVGWLGPLEHRILERVLELGFERFRPSDLGLDVDRRRLWDALQRLVRKGVLERVGRGLYRVATNIARVLSAPVRRLASAVVKGGSAGVGSQGRGDGTGGRLVSCGSCVGSCGGSCGCCGGSVLVVEGPFFDNVRGVSVSGRFVCGDRGRVRDSRELVFFSEVSYAEVLYRVKGVSVPGVLKVYTNAGQDGCGCVRVEWCPPGGYVKRNGLASAVRMYWEVVLNSARALVELLLREAPGDVRRRFLAWLRRRGVAALLRGSGRLDAAGSGKSWGCTDPEAPAFCAGSGHRHAFYTVCGKPAYPREKQR